jgi:glycosyltransferase involved in cell wall biosynthesis
MKICMTFYEEAEKRLTGDHERVIGIACALKSLGHDVCLVEGAFDDRRFKYKGIKIFHTNRTFTRQFESKLHRLTSIIDRITQIQGTLSKLSYLLLDEPFITFKTREVMAASDIVMAVGDLTIGPIIYAKMLNKKVILDCLSFYLQSVYRMRGYVSLYSYYSRLVFHTLLGKLSYHIADRIIVPSYNELKYSTRTFKVPEDKVSVIPNGIDTKLFKPNQEARERVRSMLGINASDTIMLFLGGHMDLENELAVKYIVNTLAPTVLSKHNNTFFVITGPWKKNDDDPHVIFTGYVRDVNEFINAADVCIAPLVTGTGTKIKMLAYMACGKVTVATPVAAEGINLLHGEQALIYEINNFTDGVLYAIENRTNLTDLGKNARTHVQKHYSWNKITTDLNRVITTLTK